MLSATEDQTPNPASDRVFKSKQLNFVAIIFFVTLATVLVFNTLGLFPWGIWSVLLRLWPIFIFMILLQLLGKRYPTAIMLGTAIGLGVVISLIIFSLSPVNKNLNVFLANYSPQLTKIRKFLGLDLGERLSSQVKVQKDDFPEVKFRVIRVEIQTGSFNLTDYPDSNYLITQSNYYEKFGKPAIQSFVEDNTLFIDLSTQKSLLPILGGSEDVRYDISIGQTEVPTRLFLDVGAASFYSYFKNLNIDEMNVSVGTGKADVSFNENTLPAKKLDINVGAGSLQMILPYGTFAKINYKIGFGTLQINNLTFKKDGFYTTPNYRIESQPLEINVNIGAGTVYIDASGG